MKVPSFGELEAAPCNLCASKNAETVVVQHWFGEDFHVVKCAECGMIRTNPRPSPEWKASFYDPEKNGLAEKMGREFVYAPAPDRLPSYQRLLDYIRDLAPPPRKLIDIGAASCVFAKISRDAGYDVVACDYSDDALEYGRREYGVNTLQSPAEQIDADDNSFDVVTIFHTVEHLADPHKVLTELHRILKPGGTIFLETPNYAPHAMMQKRFGLIWPLYKFLTKRQHGLPWVPFDHYYHWTHRHLADALSKAGFVEPRSHHILGYRSNTKPNFVFWAAYLGYDCLAQVIRKLSLGRIDLTLVLLASAKKP